MKHCLVPRKCCWDDKQHLFYGYSEVMLLICSGQRFIIIVLQMHITYYRTAEHLERFNFFSKTLFTGHIEEDHVLVDSGNSSHLGQGCTLTKINKHQTRERMLFKYVGRYTNQFVQYISKLYSFFNVGSFPIFVLSIYTTTDKLSCSFSWNEIFPLMFDHTPALVINVKLIFPHQWKPPWLVSSLGLKAHVNFTS